MAEAQKDTIYIDVDDEITGIIDKLRNAPHKIVALVLPKRATVLQSIVNMKLLKKAGDDAKKNIVLITSEAGLLPLAGAVKLHVAKTLQSKPEIPEAPDVPSNDVDLEEAEIESEPDIDKTKPVGDLAGEKPAKKGGAEPEETIELDEPTDEEPKKKTSKAAKKADKKLKVPNFNSFRKRLVLIGAGVFALILFLILAIFVLPKATVTLKTDNLTVDTEISFTASTSAQEFDEKDGVVPAVSKEATKTDTEKVAATGKKNVGEKARGTVTLQNCTKTNGNILIPAGTIVSNNGLNFTVDQDYTLPEITQQGLNKCTTPVKTLNVTAQSSGDQYNLSGGRSFAVSGFSNVNGTDSSAMTGGTTKNVSVVSQEDVDNVKQKLTEKSKGAARDELKKSLESTDLFPLLESFSNNETKFSSSPNVGDEASEVTVTGVTVFKMLGVQRDDLKKLVEASAKDKIDSEKQAIADDGLDDAVFRLVDAGDGNQQKMTAQVQLTTGTQINEDDVKAQVKGKKRGDIEKALQTYPGVKAVDVKFSPFWVSKAPKKDSRIKVVLEKAPADGQQQ